MTAANPERADNGCMIHRTTRLVEVGEPDPPRPIPPTGMGRAIAEAEDRDVRRRLGLPL